jgi:hypothetical protein
VSAISTLTHSIFHIAALASTLTQFETYSRFFKEANAIASNFTVQLAVFFNVPYNLTFADFSIVAEPLNVIVSPALSVFAGVYVNKELPIFKYNVEKY